MAGRGEGLPRSMRAPMRGRARRRWALAGGVAACWAVLIAQAGSLIAGTVVLLFLAGLVAAAVAMLRFMGFGAAHPWVQALRSRPWRDGQDVLRLGMSHLPDVFVLTPGGSLLAPNWAELRLSPRDFASLQDLMDVSLLDASATEVYQEEIAAHGARLGRPGAAGVRVLADPSVPPGRYLLRQARPLDAQARPLDPAAYPPAPAPRDPEAQLVMAGGPPAPARAPVPGGPPAAYVPAAADLPGPRAHVPAAARLGAPGYAPAEPPRAAPPVVGAVAGDWPFAHDGLTRGERVPAGTAGGGMPTVAEPALPRVPALRLVTDGAVTQTRTSGARAGRGQVELVLPEVPTISREHARFTYTDGQWWVENLGRNGLTLNGTVPDGPRPVHDGDSIRWGSRAGALVSRVEIS